MEEGTVHGKVCLTCHRVAAFTDDAAGAARVRRRTGAARGRRHAEAAKVYRRTADDGGTVCADVPAFLCRRG